MNQLVENFIPFGNSGFDNVTFMPAAEIHETSKTIELKLEIPGKEAKQLDVRVTEDAVAMSGERRSELHYGKFQRVIPLPARIQNAQVKADYKNVLRFKTDFCQGTSEIVP